MAAAARWETPPSLSVFAPGSRAGSHELVAKDLERLGVVVGVAPVGAEALPWCTIVDLETGSLPFGPAFWKRSVHELANIVLGAVAEGAVVPVAAVKSALCILPQGPLSVSLTQRRCPRFEYGSLPASAKQVRARGAESGSATA